MSVLSDIGSLQKNIDELGANIAQKQIELDVLIKRLSTIDTWSTKVKNGIIRKQMFDVQNIIYELQKKLCDTVKSLELQETKRKQFAEFLQPIIDAGFLVYDDGEIAYTAQQLRFLKKHNEITEGSCLHNPELFKKAEKYFVSVGYTLCSKNENNANTIFPGDLSQLDTKYKNYVNKSLTSLRDCCFNNNRRLTIEYSNGFSLMFT